MTPYLIGTLWHGLHSKVSVCTGDTRKPRGWYIDENSLDPTHFRMSAQYNPVTRKGMSKTECMCEALEAYTIGEPNSNNHFGSTLSCHQIEEKIEIARIVPLTTAVAPVDQAVVLVVPDWNAAAYPWVSGRPFEMWVDASDEAWSICLCQRKEPAGTPQIIAFVAKGFSDEATRWSAFEREIYCL